MKPRVVPILVDTPTAGCGIDDYAITLIAVAQLSGRRVQGSFNDIELLVRPSHTVQSVRRQLEKGFARERVKNAPQAALWKAKASYSAHDVAKAVRQLIQQMRAEGERNPRTICEALAPHVMYMDSIYVDKAVFVELHTWLTECGFVSGEFVGDSEVRDLANQDKCWRYLLGQALSCMDSGLPPHPIFTDWTARWGEHFGPTP